MKYLFLVVTTLFFLHTFAQQTPDKIYGQLFIDVQNGAIFADSKTFVDCTPKRNPQAIVADYEKVKGKENFSLKNFVSENFEVQKQPNVINTKDGKTPVIHIEELWTILTRAQDKKVVGSSLLALPKPYIVPGGRFTEVYYWDSYFTMLGLKESGKVKTIENMIDNFAFLITTYGHIPNGNRSYYLSRSQPPFFGMMVELLASIKGKSVYKKYLPALQKEYNFWMDGVAKLKNGEAYKRVVKLKDGTVLNRYCDDYDIPRQEGYKEDVKTAEEAVNERMMTMRFASEKAMNEFIVNTKKQVYKDLRSAAESGYDFSSRWFTDVNKLSTIHTTDFLPTDLNGLIMKLEAILIANGGKVDRKIADNRMKAIDKYLWNEEKSFYCDYDFNAEQNSGVVAASAFILMANIDLEHADGVKSSGKKIANTVQNFLLKDGGIVSTTTNNGQQWDAPNGWAPQQWTAVKALENYGQKELAKDIATRWINLNNKVYYKTGKFTEKYNVVDLSLETGGGEYPNLDGFGWTNGVYLALVKKYNLK